MATTGTYSINNTEFIDFPTSGKWLPRKALGYDGFGHPIYPNVYDFEIDWDLISPPGYQQIENFYLSSRTGTMVVNLPIFGLNDLIFTQYSGCTLDEVTQDAYFAQEGWVSNLKLLVHKIVVR